MKKFNKRFGRSRSGVSDIIGNLLILAITVTLFSSIMFYVANMPEPARATFTDLEPRLSNIQDDDSIYINITHKGGQPLRNWSTGIYIFVNGVLIPENHITNSEIDIGDTWETGETWSNRTYFSGVLSSLSVTIVDKDTNSIVWQNDLLGGVTNIQLAPIIGSRYTSPSPGLQNLTLGVYAQVIDPNDDPIVDVHLDLSTIGLTSNLTMTRTFQNFWFAELPEPAKMTWDNMKIAIYAKDSTGLSSMALMTLDIYPQGGGGNNGGGNPGWPPGNLDYSGLQGFAIFEWKDWEANRFAATPTNIFNWGSEDAVVVVASKYVVNTNTENTIRVLNQTTKVIQAPVSSPNNQYQQYDFISGYYVYNCTIDTSKLAMKSNYYLLETVLKDNWVPSNSFVMNSRIFVAYPEGAVAGYPKILTFRDSGFSVPETDFTTFNPNNNRIFVELQNVFGSPWAPSSGDVEIRDFFWNAQIKKTPAYVAGASTATAWNGPVSNLWQVTALPAPPGVYRFVINLGNATDGWPWIGGDNAYVLRFDMFKAGPETYLLNKIIHVEAPKVKLDIVAGGPPAGAARFQEQSSLVYYANTNNWAGEQLEVSNDKQGYSPTINVLKAGDINGDGQSDFIAAMYDNVLKQHVLISYIRQPFGSGWIKTTIDSNLGGIPRALELGNLDLDNDLDIVMIRHDSQVFMYRNDGAWTRSTIDSTTTVKNTLLIGDMDPPLTPGNDPNRSQDIVIGFDNGQIKIYRNQFGDGTSWTQDTLSTTGSSSVDYWADGEVTLLGSVVNTYLETQSPFQDPGVYQEIREEITWRYANPYPSEKDGNDTVPDSITELRVGDEDNPYTVLYNQVAHIKKWDSTGLLDDLTTSSVKLVVRFKTTNYEGGTDHLIWHNGATPVNLMQINNTNGAWVQKEFDLTSHFPYASTLKDLSVSFTNTYADGSSVDFDYWLINVAWKTGDAASHVYHFTLPSGTNNQFFVYAAKNNSADTDNFRFYYSLDNINWTPMTLTPTNTINAIWPNFIQYSTAVGFIPNGSPEVWIKVADVASPLTSNPTPTWVRIGQMFITATTSTTIIGDKITAMDLADVDGNGANDIIVSSRAGNFGKIHVMYNRLNGIFVNIMPVITESTSKGPLYNAQWIYAGAFFNPYQKGYLDIVYGSSTAVYNILNPGLGGGSWTGATQTMMFDRINGATFTLKKLWAGDIDGNGRTDLLMATSAGGIWYYSNYLGNRSTVGWQLYQIDQLSAPSGPTPALNDMDACFVLA